MFYPLIGERASFLSADGLLCKHGRPRGSPFNPMAARTVLALRGSEYPYMLVDDYITIIGKVNTIQWVKMYIANPEFLK